MRDMNFIQALEKAVKEKYGEEATHNPKQFWDEEKEKQYIEQQRELNNKKYKYDQTREKVELDGVLLPKKLINKNINKECSICKKYSFDKRDDLYLNKFKACYRCYLCELEVKKDG
jgi:phage-related protein